VCIRLAAALAQGLLPERRRRGGAITREHTGLGRKIKRHVSYCQQTGSYGLRRGRIRSRDVWMRHKKKIASDRGRGANITRHAAPTGNTHLLPLCLGRDKRDPIGSGGGACEGDGRIPLRSCRVVAGKTRVTVIVVLSPVKTAHVAEHSACCSLGSLPPDSRVTGAARTTEDSSGCLVRRLLIEAHNTAFVVRVRWHIAVE